MCRCRQLKRVSEGSFQPTEPPSTSGQAGPRYGRAGKKGRGGRRAVLASYLSQKLALAQFSGSSIVLDRTARQARLTVSPLTTLHFQLPKVITH